MDRKLGIQKELKPKHITGIDGLRTIAVLGVIAYHLLPNVLQGGYLGVPLFLLISGYFITYHFSERFDQHEKVNFKRFYFRRFYRLYPVLLAMLIVTIAYMTLFAREMLEHIRAIFFTNISWVYNWWEVYNGQSYFDQFTNKSPFTHLWTLGVEAQFYLAWPVILYLLFRIIKKKSIIKWFVLTLAILSAIEMAVLYQPSNLNRVYYGTDTRAFSLLLGSWLALVWPINRLNTTVPVKMRNILDGIGLGALAITLFGFFTLDGQADLTYHGGMFWYSLVGTVLLAIILHPASRMNGWLTNRFFTWCGQRSYGIYVYQYPVLVFYERMVNVGYHPFVSAFEELALIVIISEFSYRVIEQPIAHLDWSKLKWTNFKWRNWQHTVPSGIAATILMISLVGLCLPNPNPKKAQVQQQIEKNSKLSAEHNKQVENGSNVKAAKTSTVQKQYSLTKSEIKQAQKLRTTAVGDSVMLDASADLQKLMPNTYVDAKVGRQGIQTPKVLQQLKSSGKLNDIVILNLGNNGPLEQSSVDSMLKVIGSKREVYWVTPHIPNKNWQQQVNGQIKAIAKKNKNVHVVDWYTESMDHSDWFAKDGVHMNEEGNIHYAKLITKTILKTK